jgi:2'-5' RNA ligase
MPESIRAFIAVDLPGDLRTRIDPILSDLSSLGRDLKVVKGENLHFTVKFLGNIAPDMIEPIANCIRSQEESLGFDMEIGRLGAFPNARKPRVVWIGANCPDNEFVEMARGIDTKLVDLGFDRERSYVPHLTVARVRNRRGAPVASGYLEKMENLSIGRMTVDSITLKKSVLTPGGPIYSDMVVLGKGGN